MVGFPSGQREQTVNLPSSTSKVRILPPPPSLSKVPELSNESVIKYSAHAGKDEKLRPRFDSSASERALPQATTRRAKRAALSNPSPTTITFKSP
ncbi:tpr protein; flags: fragment [Escherichia coli chi7122]|nr:tpr protein; flags: fragment [Escherichia coli chi7122]